MARFQPSILVILSFAVVTIAVAQERLSQEQAQRYGKLLGEAAAKLTDAQITTQADPEKTFGIRGDGRVALVIPDKRLTPEVLAKADKEVVPVGQLWLHRIVPLIEDRPIANDKIRLVAVTGDNQAQMVPLYLLGLKKNKEGALELLIYGKDKDPLLKLPVKDSDVKQELPIELEGRGENSGVITLRIIGKYQASLTVGPRDS